jgi:hypothetical protein
MKSELFFSLTTPTQGWYATGAAATRQHLEATAQVLAPQIPNPARLILPTPQLLGAAESPLFLLLDASPRPGARDLPVALFERVAATAGMAAGAGAAPAQQFAAAAWALATEEAERIGIEHMAHTASASAGSDGALC